MSEQMNLRGKRVQDLEKENNAGVVHERQGKKYRSDFGRFFRGLFGEIGVDKFKKLVDAGAGESESNLARLLKSELKTSVQLLYWDKMFKVDDNKTFVGRDGQVRQSRFRGGDLGKAIYKNYFEGKHPSAIEKGEDGHFRVKEGREFSIGDRNFKAGEVVPKKDLRGLTEKERGFEAKDIGESD